MNKFTMKTLSTLGVILLAFFVFGKSLELLNGNTIECIASIFITSSLILVTPQFIKSIWTS